jgi:hypothetical protein
LKELESSLDPEGTALTLATAERTDKAWNTLKVEPIVANVCLSKACDAETMSSSFHYILPTAAFTSYFVIFDADGVHSGLVHSMSSRVEFKGTLQGLVYKRHTANPEGSPVHSRCFYHLARSLAVTRHRKM